MDFAAESWREEVSPFQREPPDTARIATAMRRAEPSSPATRSFLVGVLAKVALLALAGQAEGRESGAERMDGLPGAQSSPRATLSNTPEVNKKSMAFPW